MEEGEPTIEPVGFDDVSLSAAPSRFRRQIARLAAVTLLGASPAMISGVPALAQLALDHAHIVFPTSVVADCHNDPTSTSLSPGNESLVVFCLHTVDDLPFDSAPNTVRWGTVGVGSFVGTPENETDATGFAEARINSSVTGQQKVTACFDGNGDAACDGAATKKTATRNWVLPDLHLAFAPTDPPGTGHECSAGPVATTTAVSSTDSRKFVACVHDKDTGLPLASGALVTPTVTGGGPGSISPASATTDGSGRATFTISSSQIGDSVITATASSASLQSGPVASLNTITNTWTAGALQHLHLAFSLPDASSDACSAGPFEVTSTVDAGRDFVGCAQDEFHNPLTGVAVTPTVFSGPGGVSPAAATTDGSGRATFTLSSTETGQSVITATASKGTVTVAAAGTIAHNWTAGAPTTLRLAFTPTNLDCTAPVSESSAVNIPNEFAACVFDQFGNIKPGAVVTPTVISGPGSISPATATTDDSGRAPFTVNSTQTGVSVVSATASGSTIPASNTIT